jgi:hypothetical protein
MYCKAVKKEEMIVKYNILVPPNQMQTYCKLTLWLTKVTRIHIVFCIMVALFYSCKFIVGDQYLKLFVADDFVNCRNNFAVAKLQYIGVFFESVQSLLKIVMILL